MAAPDFPRRPGQPLVSADVVNLGYVINVIEVPEERVETLKRARDLARKALIVSAQVGYFEQQTARAKRYQDGYLSSRQTFQKYYEQEELRELLRETLGLEPYAAGIGVFYLFQDGSAEADYCRRLVAEDLPEFAASLTAQPLAGETLDRIAELVHASGRLPLVQECPELGPAIAILSASENWMGRLNGHLDSSRLNAIRAERKRLVLHRLATSSFSLSGRLRMPDLTEPEKADVRSLFGSYTRASQEADRLLQDVLRLENIREALADSAVGKRTTDASYVHTSAEDRLPEVLGHLIGCARAAAELELADGPPAELLKFSTDSLAVSFASYPGFDSVEHPSLVRAVRVDFETGLVTQRSYAGRPNPPILHRKELFVSQDYPLYRDFLHLSRQEMSLGLLGRRDIGTLEGWHRLLESRSLRVENHQVITGEGAKLASDGEATEHHYLWTEDEDDLDESVRRLSKRVGRKKKASPPPFRRIRATDQQLELFAQTVAGLGRLPLVHEYPDSQKVGEWLSHSYRWRELIAPWFDEATYEQQRQRLWESVLLELGTALFTPGGRVGLKRLPLERQADIRALFGTYTQACAEADSWMRKMGDAHYVETEVLNWGRGRLRPEKGLYVHTSLLGELPLVAKLLARTAELLAGVAKPEQVDLVRITPNGDCVKFYSYEDFDNPRPSRLLEACKVLFRKRKIIAYTLDEARRPRIALRKDDLVDSSYPAYPAFVEMTAKLQEAGLLPNVRLEGISGQR